MPSAAPCLRSILAVLIFAALTAPAAAQDRVRLAVASTLEVPQIRAYKLAFEADNPDIELVLTTDATGVVTARLLAEKDNPRTDAVWGLAVTSMIALKQAGALEPYAPANLAAIKPSFRDAADPPHWVGIDAWVAAICFNTREAARLGLKPPRRWGDLLDPAYRGRIVMPNPASSGTGYFHVSAWLQLMGEDAAWRYMDRLNDNIAVYVHSGSKPCRMAAAGEFPIAIAYELAGATARQQGAPIDVLLMAEGGGWDMDATAILRGTKQLAAARRLADWSASRKANELYSRYLAMVAIDGIRSPIPEYPDGVARSMIKNDFEWAARERGRILAEWRKRYDAKSEKR